MRQAGGTGPRSLPILWRGAAEAHARPATGVNPARGRNLAVGSGRARPRLWATGLLHDRGPARPDVEIHHTAPTYSGRATPAEIADVPCKVPKTTTHTTRARVSCETHGREWFEADGRDCFECAKERLTAAKAKRETPRGPRVVPTYFDRPARPDRAPMTAERVAEIEAELVGDGWRKREGQWKKR